MSTITIVGLTLILLYALINLLNFYGVGSDVYMIYLLFYLFLLLCYFVFGRNKKLYDHNQKFLKKKDIGLHYICQLNLHFLGKKDLII